MSNPFTLACPVGGPFHRTVIVDTVLPRVVTVSTHGEPGGTERSPRRVDLRRGAGGRRVLTPPRIQGNDGRDGFGLEKLIDAVRIEATIVDDRTHSDRQGVGGTGLKKAVQTGRSHGEVRDMARGDVQVHRQGMLCGDHAVLKVAVAKEVRVPIGVIAPGGGRITVVPLMIAAEDALGATVAGGPAVGTGSGGEARAITTEDEGAEVAQQATLGRG